MSFVSPISFGGCWRALAEQSQILHNNNNENEEKEEEEEAIIFRLFFFYIYSLELGVIHINGSDNNKREILQQFQTSPVQSSPVQLSSVCCQSYTIKAKHKIQTSQSATNPTQPGSLSPLSSSFSDFHFY